MAVLGAQFKETFLDLTFQLGQWYLHEPLHEAARFADVRDFVLARTREQRWREAVR